MSIKLLPVDKLGIVLSWAIGHNYALIIIVDLHFTFTFSHLADAFIQSDLELGST